MLRPEGKRRIIQHMKIISTAPSADSEASEVSFDIPRFNEALMEESVEVQTIEFDSVVDAQPPAGWGRMGRTAVGLAQGTQLKHVLQRAIAASVPVVLHDHGVCLRKDRSVAQAAKVYDIPLIVSPHLMLSACSFTPAEGKIGWLWQHYRKRNLAGATLLHAHSVSEAQDFLDLGFTLPIAIIPEGLDISEVLPAKIESRSQNTILFLASDFTNQGLLELVEARAAIKAQGGRIIVVGEVGNTFQEKVCSAAAALGVRDAVQFLGTVTTQQKWFLYRQSDFLFVPGHSGRVATMIAAALACELPVITTESYAWRDLEMHRCGWCAPLKPGALSGILKKAFSTPEAERRAMGKRGRALLESKYSWKSVSQSFRATYEWLLGLSRKPDCVVDKDDF